MMIESTLYGELLGQAGWGGGYIGVWKLATFAIFFGVWCWVGQWVDKDTLRVRTRRAFWNNIYLGIGVGAFFVWVVMPVPAPVGVLLNLVAWITLMVIYVLHRNSRLPAVERILTADHIKYLLSRGRTVKETELRLVFFSALGNELPVPHRQDTEYEGYVIAEDTLYEQLIQRVSLGRWIPQGEQVHRRYVIDGVACEVGDQSRSDMDQMLRYLKAVADLDMTDKRQPQTGEFSTRTSDGLSRWRIKTAGSTRGEQMILERIEEQEAIELDTLGFYSDQLEKVEQLIKQPEGVVLVSSPPGEGLTSTLYSLIRRHDAFIQNICSLEMKTLCELDNVTQNSVEPATSGKDASRRLQSVLRGDPDVVLVGFCNDPEMAVVGTEAAIKGAKLYYGLEAPSVFHSLGQWIRMVHNSAKVARTLLAVIHQRLVRQLCTDCRQGYVPDAKLLKKLNLPAEKIENFYRPPAEIEYDKHGKAILCEKCQGSGYFGRVAVFETLFVSESLRELIRNKSPINVIRAQCRKEKMLYLQEQAIRKVIHGTTSIQEVLRVTTDQPVKVKPSSKISTAQDKS